METIYARSPNKKRVPVGQIDYFNRIAIFWITPERYFQEANAIGIDKDVLKRKSVRWCKKIVFQFWDKRYYRISMEDFKKNCWLYPPKRNPRYKAHPGVFKPKWVITLDKIQKLDRKNREEEEIEMLNIAMT